MPETFTEQLRGSLLSQFNPVTVRPSILSSVKLVPVEVNLQSLPLHSVPLGFSFVTVIGLLVLSTISAGIVASTNVAGLGLTC